MKEKPKWDKKGKINSEDFNKKFDDLIKKIRNTIVSLPKSIKDKFTEDEALEFIKSTYISNKQDLDKATDEEKKLIKHFEKKVDLKINETSGVVLSALEYIQKSSDTKENVKNARKEYKLRNVSKSYKTDKLSLNKKREDISNVDRDALHEDRVYSELLVKISAPEEISKNLKNLWKKYLSSKNNIDKKENQRNFLVEYNKYTKALEKVLKVFYEEKPDIQGETEEEIFKKLKEITENKKTLKKLVSEYKKIQPDKFFDKKVGKMSKELEPTYILNDIFFKAYKYLEMKNRARDKYLINKKFKINEYQFQEFNDSSESVKPEPTSSETVKPENTKPESKKPEPVSPESIKPENTKPESKKPEPVKKIKIKTAFISYSDKLAKIYARDMAERKISDSYKESKPQKFTSKIGNGFKRIWKHGLFREYYRQKEIDGFKKDIIKNKNLFIDEDLSINSQSNLNTDIIERLISVDDLSQVVHTGDKVKKLEDKELKNRVINSIKLYALGLINDSEFIDYQKNISDKIKEKNPEIFGESVIDANNLLETAKGLKIAFIHNKGLKNADIDLDIIIGDIKTGVRTEQKLSGLDRLIDKMGKTKVGKFVNETTLASALSIAHGIGNTLGTFFLYNKVASFASLGGTVLLSGILGSSRKRNYLDQKRNQHLREVASGRGFNIKDKQRLIFERFRTDSLSASKTIDGFKKVIDALSKESLKDKITIEKVSEYISAISHVDSRINLSDNKLIDLISYTSPNTIDKERTQLDILRAKLKVKLRKISDEKGWTFGGKSFDEYLSMTTDLKTRKLQEDENGINQKNKEFAKYKCKEGMKTFVKSAVTGLVIGVVAQETAAAINPNQQGAFESWFGKIDQSPKSQTALKNFTDFLSNKYNNSAAGFLGQTEMFHTNSKPETILLDSNRELILGNDGNYDLYQEGKMVSDNIISFEEDGALINNASNWKEQGILVDSSQVNTISDKLAKTNISVDQVSKINPEMVDVAGKRAWIRNNTTGFYDRNELGLGLNSNANGDPIIDISGMTESGSFSGNQQFNISEAIKNGNAKILVSLSEESAGKVFELPLDSNGIIIDKANPLYPLFSVNNNNISFNGGTIEVAIKENNVWNILSTVTGKNTIKDFNINTQIPEIINTVSIKTIPEQIASLPYTVPPFIPINPDKPLTGGNKNDKEQQIHGTPIKIDIENTKDTKDKKYKKGENIDIEYNKKLSGEKAGFELAKIAESQEIDLTKLSREKYAQFAKDNYLKIGSNELRMLSEFRKAKSKEEIEALKKEKIKSIDGNTVKEFNSFSDRIKSVAKKADSERSIDPNIEVAKGTKDSNHWLFFNVNGGYTSKENTLSKAYFSFKNLSKFKVGEFAKFLRMLRDKGLKCDIKVFQKIDTFGSLINDQVVIHGSDAKLALDLASTHFGNNINNQNIGYDKMENGKWKSYSEILAEEIERHVNN
jgi:hypothetical protein